nr:hypothetical protein [Tanacetum cinerariifolium]
AAGNVETVKIMVQENEALLRISGAEETMPLYAAAMFGNDKVVKYLYEKSQELDGWTDRNRSWLVEKCMESDMFGGILARKPEAFRTKESNIIGRTIKTVLDQGVELLQLWSNKYVNGTFDHKALRMVRP